MKTTKRKPNSRWWQKSKNNKLRLLNAAEWTHIVKNLNNKWGFKRRKSVNLRKIRHVMIWQITRILLDTLLRSHLSQQIFKIIRLKQVHNYLHHSHHLLKYKVVKTKQSDMEQILLVSNSKRTQTSKLLALDIKRSWGNRWRNKRRKKKQKSKRENKQMKSLTGGWNKRSTRSIPRRLQK